jgi:hypothetical protein
MPNVNLSDLEDRYYMRVRKGNRIEQVSKMSMPMLKEWFFDLLPNHLERDPMTFIQIEGFGVDNE